ncbi:Major capsid protein [Bienertia sinuspersici]
MTKIKMKDIEEKVNYWSSALVCYVPRANLPFSIINGYCNRTWSKHGLDKVPLVGRDLFLVRFHNVAQCEKVLSGDRQFFNSKPVIIKKWEANMELHKDTIKLIPIWIRFPHLELKYWGTRCLHKLGDNIRTTLKLDSLTEKKERLAFTRIMVKVTLDKELPKVVCFQNEKGVCVEQVIEYECRPSFCAHYKRFGHRT